MFPVYIGILTFGSLLLLLGLFEKLPSDFICESRILYPFYKSGSLICKVIKIKKSSLLGIRKQIRQVYPSRSETAALNEYRIRQYGKAFMLIFFGNMLALALCVTELSEVEIEDGHLISRNSYGEGEKTVNADIYADGELILPEEEITISERRYTEEEVENKFSEIGPVLEQEILGDNKSLDMVIYDLNFPEKIDGYPFSIEWELSDYTQISGDGHIRSENTTEEGNIVIITAVMTYLSFQGEHSFNAVIYKMPESEGESFSDNLRGLISEYEELTCSEEKSILPKELDGKEITYRESRENTSLGLFAVIVILSLFIYLSGESELSKKLRKRQEEMMLDYPQIVGKTGLLLGAGMTVNAAFTKLGQDYEKMIRPHMHRYAYEEILLTVRELSSGVPETEAYERFGNRCNVQKYIKFGSMLSQNLKKGSTGLLMLLESEERDAFEDRKAMAKRLGETASTRLLIPMTLMLLVVLVIIIIPAFLSF